jgi:hypothetical protein
VTAEVVWLAVLAGLAAVATLVVRRMSRLIGRTRDLERFQRSATELELRFRSIADPLIANLDAGRRGAVDADELLVTLAAATGALRAVATDGRAAVAPTALARQAAGLVYELERGVRAAELAEHALGLTPARGSERDGGAGTAVKRGALNLRHARDAIHGIVAEISAVRPADLAQVAASRSSATNRPPGMYIVDEARGEGEEPFEHRM